MSIMPRSLMRASVVRSGCWNTVTRTASPAPSLSPVCANPGKARAISKRPLIIETTMRIIVTSPLRELTLELPCVLDPRHAAQPLHLRCRDLQAPAARQELLDQRRGLLLRKRGLLG